MGRRRIAVTEAEWGRGLETMMDVGVILPTMSRRDGWPGDIPAAARQAEDLGFESIWSVDQLVAGTGVPLLDSLTALAGAAAVTERIRLGVGVLILPLRPVTWTAKHEWFVSGGPDDIPHFQALAAERAGRFGRPVPAITTSVLVALDGDPSVPDRDTIIGLLTDPDGMFGLSAEAAPDAFLAGGQEVLADLLGRLAAAGVHRTVVQFVGGDWSRQAELAAGAWAQAD